ncbi:hypothetical protein QAD02_001895 [Eretmocerus hayati]|uniref:Uncharacterized protein n=1 Tax=Eretmocerus hayati TaxID=131215 RepID=A0ACC2NIA5_9HYME|nr:hypothetical protein QAD02_001895 [Eretmocerus hayati]
MSGNYSKDLRIVGANFDEVIAKEVWNIPRILLYKNNEEDQGFARKLIQNLKDELNNMKDELEKDKDSINRMRETYSQVFQETCEAVESLKQSVNEMKNLFVAHGFVDESAFEFESSISALNIQLESMSVME